MYDTKVAFGNQCHYLHEKKKKNNLPKKNLQKITKYIYKMNKLENKIVILPMYTEQFAL